MFTGSLPRCGGCTESWHCGFGSSAQIRTGRVEATEPRGRTGRHVAVVVAGEGRVTAREGRRAHVHRTTAHLVWKSNVHLITITRICFAVRGCTRGKILVCSAPPERKIDLLLLPKKGQILGKNDARHIDLNYGPINYSSIFKILFHATWWMSQLLKDFINFSCFIIFFRHKNRFAIVEQ